ncbi:MAG: zinc-ribbon domain-containing protein [Desulfobacteraceae bacterium]|nr:zinc-ribbon domain-containing protein [Desulfobacteraceae bacterium]
MIITCEACGTSYKVKADLISKDGSTVKCSRCQHIFVAHPPAGEQETSAQSPSESDISAADYPRPHTATFFEDATETEDALDRLFTEEDGEAPGAGEKEDLESEAGQEFEPEIDDEDLFADFEREFEEELEPEEKELAMADLESGQEEIGLSDLEPGDSEISLSDLESGEQEISFSDLQGAEQEISFSELETVQEEIGLSDLEPESETISLSALETRTQRAGESYFDDTVQEDFDLDLEKEIFERSTATRTTFSDRTIPEDTRLTDVTLSDLEFKGEEVWMADLELVTQEIGLSDLEAEEQQIDFSELESGAGSEPEIMALSELETVSEEEPEKQPEPAVMEETAEAAEAAEKGPALADTGEEEFDFDLDLEEEELESGEEEETDLDLDDLDLDLDLSLETEEEMKTEQEEFDQTGAEPEVEEEPEVETEPEVEEEPGEKSADDELELGIELEEEEDFESAEPEEPQVSGEEESRDFDFGLEKQEAESEKGGSEEELFEFDLGLEEEESRDLGPALETSPETGAGGTEEEDFDIDLSTMLEEATQEERTTEEDISLEPVEDKDEYTYEDFEPPEDVEKTRPESADTIEYGSGDTAGPAEEELFAKQPYRAAAPLPAEGRGRARKILTVFAALIVLVLAAGGAYLYLTGQQLPGLGQPPAPDPGNMRIAVSSPNYRIVENEQAGRLLVVSGTVTNRYDHPRSHILLRANLFDGAGNRVGRAAAYCGNIFEESELKTLDTESINNRLTRRQGEGGANTGVGPGRSVPYMIVFSDLPGEMESLTVEALSSDKAQ